LRIEEKDPQVLRYVREYIEQNQEIAANERRRNDLGYVGGFSIQQLREYIKKRSLEEGTSLINISASSTRRLFEPPNKNFKSSDYYKQIFNIKRIGGFSPFYKIRILFRREYIDKI